MYPYINRFFVFFIPALLFIFQAIIRLIPSDIKNTDQLFTQMKNNFGLQLQAYIVGAIILIFLIYQYYTIQKPYEKFLKFEKVKDNIFDEFIKPVIKNYEDQYKIKFRLNIMLRKYGFIPVWPFFGLKFHTVYSVNMRYAMDKHLHLSIKQGVAGISLAKGFLFADLSKGQNQYKLTNKQIEKTKNLKFVASIPIWETQSTKVTDNIIGVINLDSVETTFKDIQKNVKIEEEIRKKLEGFSSLASLIF